MNFREVGPSHASRSAHTPATSERGPASEPTPDFTRATPSPAEETPSRLTSLHDASVFDDDEAVESEGPDLSTTPGPQRTAPASSTLRPSQEEVEWDGPEDAQPAQHATPAQSATTPVFLPPTPRAQRAPLEVHERPTSALAEEVQRGRTAEQMRLRPDEREKLLASVPMDEVIDAPGGSLSAGFEAEFEHYGDVDGPYVAARHDFLENSASVEHTGNHEVRSHPSDTLGPTLAQMRELKGELGEDLRGFHLTVQVPQVTVEEMGRKDFEAWIARQGDQMMAWRAENKDPFFAFRTQSTGRPDIRSISTRSTIRAYPMEDTERYRVEFRGNMKDVDRFELAARQLAAGVTNPGYVQGFHAEQDLLGFSAKNATPRALLREANGGTRLTREQKDALDTYAARLGDGRFLPGMGFEHAPYVTQEESARLAAAREAFAERALPFLSDASLSSKARGQAIDGLMAEWARESKLTDILDQSILTRPGAPAALSVPVLAKGAEELSGPMAKRIDEAPEQEQRDVFQQLDTDVLQRYHQLLKRLPAGERVRAELESRGVPLDP